MATLTMAPRQWHRYKDISDGESVNDDLDGLAEASAALKKHGKREWFGVVLLHNYIVMAASHLKAISAVAIVVCITSAAQAQPVNLIANGNFEAGNVGFTLSPGSVVTKVLVL